MKPMTLRERVDSIAHDLSSDDTLFSSVLDKYIEKKAEATTPQEVFRIARQLEVQTGLSKEAALHSAWETYLKYVNPEFVKNGGKMPPQFMKKKDKDGDKDEDKKDDKKKGDEKSEKKDEKKDSDKKEDSKEEKEDGPPWKTAAAQDLALKLGATRKVCVMTKEAPKQKKMQLKTAAARELAEALGV